MKKRYIRAPPICPRFGSIIRSSSGSVQWSCVSRLLLLASRGAEANASRGRAPRRTPDRFGGRPRVHWYVFSST
jgi:hypothetical protein